MKTLLAAAASIALFTLGAAVHAQSSNVNFGATKLALGMNLIDVDVAETAAAREQGLMYRKSLPLNGGMLFDFERPAIKVCMWMKNTDIPLSVAFMDNQGVILNIEDMQPQTLDNHCSAEGKAVRYALEMQLGWFAQKHVRVGDQVKKADSAS